MKKSIYVLINVLFISLLSCQTPVEEAVVQEKSKSQKMVDEYVSFALVTDLSKLTDKEKEMIPILIEVAKIMDGLFWQEAYGDKASLMAGIEDEATRQFAEINYGPWDRLRANAPFIDGAGEKPLGAQYYPHDMTTEEFEAFDNDDKSSLYTFVKRNESGELYTVPYHEAFKDEVEKASALLKKAAALAEDDGLKKYLEVLLQQLNQ